MTTEEQQAITIDTLTKRLRSAIDSAQAHQRNAIQKELELCAIKMVLRKLVYDIGSAEYNYALQTAKDYLAK